MLNRVLGFAYYGGTVDLSTNLVAVLKPTRSAGLNRRGAIAQSIAIAAIGRRYDPSPARQPKNATTSSRRAIASASPSAISARVYGASNSR